MKRKLSLLLAVVMILGSFSFAFAADEVVPAEFLEKEGILVGNDSGDLMLDKSLLRKDAVVLLARLMKAEKEAEAFEKEGLPTFNDLADNPYYKGFLAWAEDNGYFTGKTDGSFGYADNLEAVEYALVLLRALGYVNDNKADEWDNAWTEAEKLGLLEDVKAERRDEIKREEVAQMTYNALGVTMKDSDKTLAEFLGITMPEAKELTATVNDTENLKEVVVELSNAKLANKDKLENTANYRLSGNVIERVEVKDNNVLVQVRDAFRSGKQYELQIKGVDKAIDGKYKFVAKDNTIPSVEKVEVLGEYGIKVVTSEPIEDVRGKNFLVDGKYIVMNVEKYGRNLVLTPYNGSFPSNADTLTIEGLKDYAGYKSAKEDFDIEIVKDNEAPKVEDVILKGNKVEVVFDKDIYKDSVEAYYSRSSVGNISYELGRHTIYADKATKIDTNKVSYEFKDNEAPSRRDEVTIVDVTNHSKVKMEKTTMALREVLDDIEPEIIETKISKDIANKKATIKLYFDKDVKGSFIDEDKEEKGFVVKDHFTLYEDEVSRRNELNGEKDPKIVSAKYDYDEKEREYVKDVVVVVIEGLTEWDRNTNDIEYVLEIEGFTDASSSRNKMYRDYYEFKFDKTSDFVVEDVNVKGYSRDTEIEIEFSKKLDRKIAEDVTNYTFYKVEKGKKVMKDDVEDLEGEVILKSNGTVVVLEIPEKLEDLEDDYDGLRISDAIKDTKGNRLAAIYYYDFASGKVLEEGQTVDEKAVSEVAKLVDALPEAEDIKKLEDVDEEKVEKARKAYNDLTDAQKALKAAKELDEKLTAIESKIKELKGNAQTLAEAATAVEEALEDIEREATNDTTTESAIKAKVEDVITNEKITATYDITQEPATEEKAGSVTGKITLTLTEEDGTKLVKDIEIDIEIPKVPAVTYKVTLGGDAGKDVDYTIVGAGDLDAVKEGTDLTITALNKIKVNDTVLEAGDTTTITVNDNMTITIVKAE